jgi:NADH-quinone oxidoreductase subunit M
MLTLMTFLPLLGAVIILALPKTQEKFIKYFALAMSLPSLVIAAYLWAVYNNSGGYIAVENAAWIPALGVNYHLGVDGLSLPLVALTTLLTTLSLWY